MPNTIYPHLTAAAADILNAIRNNATSDYQSYVPPANPNLSNLAAIGAPILNFESVRNAFINALLNRIAIVEVKYLAFTNRWNRFKRGELLYGETIEEIFIGIANPYQYTPANAETQVFKRNPPDVKSAFHTMNFQKYYPQTISREQLRQAFLSPESLESFITNIITSMYSAMEYDEFLMMKYVLARAILDGKLYAVQTADTSGGITESVAKEITSDIIATSGAMSYPSPKYNAYGVVNSADVNKQVVIVSNAFNAKMKVDVLASAFHMEEVDFMAEKIDVDGFGEFDDDRMTLLFTDESGNVASAYTPFTSAEKTALNAIPAVVCDRDWFMVYDVLTEIADIRNPMGLYYNYFLHVWRIYSYSPFSNATCFTPTAPSVTSVDVTPATMTVAAGQEVNVSLTATVVTAGFAPKSVVWTSNNNNVTVDSFGNVTVGATATGTATITATSTFDSTKKDTCVITIDSGT